MNNLTDIKIDESDEILFYYQGIGVKSPSAKIAIEMEKTGHAMILDDLKNKNMNDLKKEYKEELDKFVICFKSQFQNKPPNYSDIQTVINRIPGLDMQKFFVVWSTTICALLKMKVIHNDEMNGFLVVPFNTVDHHNQLFR